MKKRYWLAGLLGVASAAAVYKLATRERETVWEDFVKELPYAENSRFVEVDGVRIHFQEFGSLVAPPVFLIHGYSSSTFGFNAVAPRLAQAGFRVLVVDLIGHGFSDKPFWAEYTFEMQARMIVRLMNLLGIGRAALIGSSYGGGVAALATIDNPERVEKLVLVSAACNDEIKKLALTKLATLPIFGQVLTPFLATSKFYIRARLRNSLNPANHHLIDDKRIGGIMRPLKSAAAHNAVLMSLKNWHGERIEKAAARIKQPTLLIWGDSDKVIPPRNGERLHRLIPNSRFVIFKNCGHLPHEERTDEFLKIVAEFLKDSANK
jgi:pimeloyl-ACP methyl ester carboxylesterase